MPYRRRKGSANQKTSAVLDGSPINDGLVAAWLLNDPMGVSAFDSAGICDGTWNGTASREAPSLFGMSGNFDGSASYINVGSPTPLNLASSQQSMCAWIRGTGFGAGFQCVIGDSNSAATLQQMAMRLSNSGTPAIQLLWANTDVLSSTTTLTAGQWYFIAQSRSGSSGNWTATTWIFDTIHLQERKQATGITTNPSAQQPFAIGRLGGFNGNFFNGTIDLPRVWSRALTDIEVWNLWERPLLGFTQPRRRISGASAAVAGNLLWRRRRILA